jgi:outer membrane protein assembly factor BamA
MADALNVQHPLGLLFIFGSHRQKIIPVRFSIKLRFLFICLLHWWMGGGSTIQAQAVLDTSARVIGLPVVFYSPDTRLGFGGGGVLTFYTKDAPQRSSVTFSLAFTQRKQVLIWFPYQIYLDRGKYIFYGEVGWYDYLYQFFGIGNGFDDEYLEKYTARFPLIKANFLRAYNKTQAAGLRIQYNDYRITRYEDGGLLPEGNIAGWDGGRSSGAGLVWWLDSRDDRFYPNKGWFVETSLYNESRLTASDFRFSRLQVEGSNYRRINDKTVLALQAAATFTVGDAPFFNLAQLGGPRRLRGYFDGKYRDRHLLMMQAEYRRILYKRLGGVLFAGAGSVFGTPGESLVWRPNAGLGLRFQLSKKQKLNVRLDYGFGVRSQGFYLTFGEAF